ncbi:hypothetical protein PHYSODRAFT_502171 [Phytophthora sojae]|uniref:Uncharacterized protein n=1 Tax=Phytophthora sojae (strain P6497) TaxID=1094619 RepID=G4ZCS7_PHYSP|nr:hypothetical protein PHYSODRAFT_502171 [Phytophthora sojae]EGZ18285.1 hypothetical protein PHYSODRAFT_502171 [Phytophthora sojae]|eukprot:XP_009527343.1 hypothetical protein PHYSODRAFT_502171 [Phytophthora sojae]
MTFLHALCAAFLLSCAKLYWIMENEYLNYFANLLAPVRDRHFRTVGAALGVLGAAHGLLLLSHIGASISARQLTAYARVFAARKLVEIATQVPNAYLYSTLIARPWINHSKVALVVANCWSAFLIHQILLRSGSARMSVRVVAIVIDSLISVATAIVLPSAIFLPYAMQFDYKNLSFPMSLLYGDTEFLNLVLENRAFFFMSWTNALITAVPHASAFLVATATFDVLSRATTRMQTSTRLHRIVIPTIFVTTGAVVLVLHLEAQYGVVNGDIEVIKSMCLQQMHPWLASNFSCAIVKYNCYRAMVQTPPLDSLYWLEREMLRRITFMHCPALVVPPIIREFPSLMGIEIWNATLERWGEEAALSAQLHENMLFVMFVFVNMTGIPDGILQSPLPKQLRDLEFVHTNLTTITEDVIEPWSGVSIIYIEHSQLNEFPTMFKHLPELSELSLINNKITAMPIDFLLTAIPTYYYSLSFSRNPLRELPEAHNGDLYISYLTLEFTQLRELPDDPKFPRTALCGKNEQDWDPLGDDRYPMHLIQPFRSLAA